MVASLHRFRRVLVCLAVAWLLCAAPGTALAGIGHVRQALLTTFRAWEGTPYRYGGMSHRGIDCSGFVHLVYRQALGIRVPRSTERFNRLRHRVSRRRLMAGDLILFRIDRHTLHAGIYIGHGQFIHASKSRGVMLSSLRNPYWRHTYSKALRVMDRRG